MAPNPPASESNPPSDDELIAFAKRTLSGAADLLREPETLREAILEARDQWLTLYRITAGLDDSAAEQAST